MDAINATLLAGAVNDVTLARNACEQAGMVDTVDALNRALIRLSTVEARVNGEGFTSYRVRS